MDFNVLNFSSVSIDREWVGDVESWVRIHLSCRKLAFEKKKCRRSVNALMIDVSSSPLEVPAGEAVVLSDAMMSRVRFRY